MHRYSWLLLLAALALPASGAQGSEEERVQVPLANSPSTGPEDAPVTVVEFLDFQ